MWLCSLVQFHSLATHCRRFRCGCCCWYLILYFQVWVRVCVCVCVRRNSIPSSFYVKFSVLFFFFLNSTAYFEFTCVPINGFRVVRHRQSRMRMKTTATTAAAAATIASNKGLKRKIKAWTQTTNAHEMKWKEKREIRTFIFLLLFNFQCTQKYTRHARILFKAYLCVAVRFYVCVRVRAVRIIWTQRKKTFCLSPWHFFRLHFIFLISCKSIKECKEMYDFVLLWKIS